MVFSLLTIRELKQRRLRRRGQRLVKNEFIFYKRNSRWSRFVRYANGSKNVPRLNMQRRRSFPNGNTKNLPASSTFRRHRKTWSFHVVVLQRTAKKFTKNSNSRKKLLFCSWSLLFADVLIAVVVVICLSSLFLDGRRCRWIWTTPLLWRVTSDGKDNLKLKLINQSLIWLL